MTRKEIIDKIKECKRNIKIDENSSFSIWCNPLDFGKVRIPKDCLLELDEHQFEDDVFPIPKNYDTYLKLYYGDYMKLPPVEQRHLTHNFKVWEVRKKN